MATFNTSAVRGSGKASKWLQDAKNNLQSVDFVFFGDSNTGYGEPTTASITDAGIRKYGLIDGFGQACVDLGFNYYGTPVYNFTNGANSFYEGLGSRNSVATGNIVGTNIKNEGNTANIGILGTGYTVTGSSDFDYFFKEMSGATLSTVTATTAGFYVSHGSTANWHYINQNCLFTNTGETAYRSSDFLYLDAEPWLNQKTNAYYRVTHSFTTNGGNTGATLQVNGAIVNALPASFIFAGNGGTTVSSSFKDSELLLPRAVAAHTVPAQIRMYGFYNNLTAPIAFFFHSVYEKKIGISCSSLGFESLRKLDELRDKLIGISTADANQNGNYVGHFLNAIVRRQKAASSKNTGRVCVVIQGGTNTSNEGSTAQERADAVYNQLVKISQVITAQWVKQGNSADNITFVFLASPITNNSEMPLLSTTLIKKLNTLNITVVEHNQALPQTEYVANSLWDDSGAGAGTGTNTAQSHLTETGYISWGTAIIKNLLNYNTTVKTRKK